MELTAAGQLRNYTVFPFNSFANLFGEETESDANVGFDFGFARGFFDLGYEANGSHLVSSS